MFFGAQPSHFQRDQPELSSMPTLSLFNEYLETESTRRLAVDIVLLESIALAIR